MNPVEEAQAQIAEEFALLGNDQEMRTVYLMELGGKLPPIEEKYRTENNLVKGCQSKVWMAASARDGRMFFQADSNTEVTKGLASLLVRIFSNQTPDNILQAKITLAEDIHMGQFIGTQRSGGFASMIRRMQFDALAAKSKGQ